MNLYTSVFILGNLAPRLLKNLKTKKGHAAVPPDPIELGQFEAVKACYDRAVKAMKFYQFEQWATGLEGKKKCMGWCCPCCACC